MKPILFAGGTGRPRRHAPPLRRPCEGQKRTRAQAQQDAQAATRARARAEEAEKRRRAGALRDVMEDGQWHSNLELRERVGKPIGPAMYLVRCGTDGGPAWHIEEAPCADGGWSYRFTGLESAQPKAVRT